MLLSHMFLFIESNAIDPGAGDLATGPYQTGLSKASKDFLYTSYYVATNKLLTDLYNDMANGPLPLSVLDFPAFFVMPDKYDIRLEISLEKNIYPFWSCDFQRRPLIGRNFSLQIWHI